MSVLHLFSKKRPSPKGFQPKSTSRKVQRESFILEPILTPSGLVDGMDDTPDIGGIELSSDPLEQVSIPEIDDISPGSILDNSILDGELEEIPFITDVEPIEDSDSTVVSETITSEHPGDIPDTPNQTTTELTEEISGLEESVNLITLNSPNSTFESGVFTVGDSGEVQIDFLFDGGSYKGELAIFSLEGMDQFEPGSEDFILEASSRALSDSELGHIVIADQTEGARFSGLLGEGDQNAGEYLGAKSFVMRPGDTFGFMLVPNGQVQQVFDNPEIEGAVRPLFSLATANPDDGFHLGQIADVTGDGNTFVMEDWRVDTGSDLDYNDFIFRVEGAEGEAASLDDVIDLDHDWRDTALGKELLDYAASFLEPDDPIIMLAPEGQTKIDLELLFPHLPEEESWVFEVVDQGTQNLDPQIEGEDALIVQTQPDADIDRIAVQVTNDQGDRYVQHPILVAKGPDSATRNVVTKLLDGFGEVFEALSDRTSLEGNQELSALVASLDSLIEEQPNTLKFLIKPELLEALNFEPSQVNTAYRVIHSESVGQLLGLPVSLHEALTGSDPGAWERWLVEAHNLPSVTDGDHEFPFVGFIDFTAQEHDENTVGIFKSIDGLADQEYSLIHADDGNWVERLTELVDEVKSRDDSRAVINLSFDLTQVDDQGRVTTRYELTPEEQVALQYAQDNNVLIVVSAGNTGDKMSALGKAAELFSNLLVVGAVNRWEEKADYSAQGDSLSLVAPGGQWESNPQAFVGTSKAAAYVTAGASRIWAANPDLNYQQIKRIILDTADDLADPGWDSQTGAGLLDIEEAIFKAKQTQAQPVTDLTSASLITPYSGEGRVIPNLRPNASHAVQGALESLETSQTQILSQWDQLRQLGSSDLPVEELAQILQARTETTLNLYQELTTLAAIAAAAEQQEVEKYTLLDKQRNLRVQKITQLEQQLGELEFQKSQIDQILDSSSQDVDSELEQKLQSVLREINYVLRKANLDSKSIRYSIKSINGHRIVEETVYESLIPEIYHSLFKIPKIEIPKKVSRIVPNISTQKKYSDFTKTTPFRQAESSQVEALELKAEFLEEQIILRDKTKAFEQAQLLSTGDLLNDAIGILREEINSEQDKLAKIDTEQLDIADQLILLRKQFDTSIQDIQDFLKVLGLGLPPEQLKEEIESVNYRIEERLNGIELEPDALEKLRKIRDLNHVKVAVLGDTQLQELLQGQEFNTLIEAVSAEDLKKLSDYLNNDATGVNFQEIGLTESGQALGKILSSFADKPSKILDLVKFTESWKVSQEKYDNQQFNWQSQETQFESQQSSFLETIQNDSLVKGSLVETLSELVNRKKVLDLLNQLNVLVTEEIQLATEEDTYHEKANSVSNNVWYTDGEESFYNASQAESLRSYQQSASDIAHQRNLNWQARKSLLEELSQLDLDIDVQDIDILADPSHQGQLITSITTQEELIKPLESSLIEQVSVTDTDADQNLANLQSYEADFRDFTTASQEFGKAAIESIPALAERIEFGTIASIFDVDFFENYIKPTIFDTQLSLKQKQQLTAEKLSTARLILDILAENTATAEEIEFLKNPEIKDAEITQYLEYKFEERAAFLEGIASLTEKLTRYIQELEQSEADIESAIESLQSNVSQADVSLSILRQKQEYEFQQQVERNREVLELFQSQAQAEADINEGSILSYAKVQDQLREEIRKSILNDSDALNLENSIRKGLYGEWSKYQQLVDSTVLFVEENLAEPHSQHQTNLKDYEINITTLDAQTNAEVQGQKVINSLSFENQLRKFEIENDADFWKEIAFLLDRYELKELKELKASTPELLELKKLQVAFIQHPDVLTALQSILQKKTIKFSVLWSQYMAWRDFQKANYQPYGLDYFFNSQDANGAELKQTIEDRERLKNLIRIIKEFQIAFSQHPDVFTALKNLIKQKAIQVSILVSKYIAWRDSQFANYKPYGLEDFFNSQDPNGAELKQTIEDRERLKNLIHIFTQNSPDASEDSQQNWEQGTLAESIDKFFSKATEFSSSYVDWLNKKITRSLYEGIEATVHEISKSFALPLATSEALDELDALASERVEKISEGLRQAKGKANEYWSQAQANYKDAYAALEQYTEYFAFSQKQFISEFKDFARKYIDKNATFKNLNLLHSRLAQNDKINILEVERIKLNPDLIQSNTFVPFYKNGEEYATIYVARYHENGKTKWIFSLNHLRWPKDSLNSINTNRIFDDFFLDNARHKRNDFIHFKKDYDSNITAYEGFKKRESIRQAEYDRWTGGSEPASFKRVLGVLVGYGKPDRYTLKAIAEAQAEADSVEAYLGELLTARKSIPEKKEILDKAELELEVRQQELEDIKAQIAASELQLDDTWNEYGISADAYLASIQRVLVERGKPDREAIELQGNLWELDSLLEDRILTLSIAVDNAATLVESLTQELEKVTQQISDAADGADLAVLETKEAQLENNLQLANLHYQALQAQLKAASHKRNFVTVFNQGIKASQDLIDAYLKSPDPDATALKSLLLQIQEAILEADRLAKQAEENSQKHLLSLEKWEDTHIAQQDQVLQQAQKQRELIGTLATEVERKYDLLDEAVVLYQELNRVLERIIELLEKAGEEGNRQADLLRHVAFENRLEVISEVLGKDYTDLSEHGKKELKELASYYVGQAQVHSRKRQAVQDASDKARFARLTAEAALAPKILVRNPYQEKFKAVESRIHDALFEDSDEEPKVPKDPADFLRQAARLKLYFDWLETELENKIILKKALQYRKNDIQEREFAKKTTILEMALKERWQELSAENSIELTESEYIEKNVPRYENEFKDENILYEPSSFFHDSQSYMVNRLKEIDLKIQQIKGDIEYRLPSQQAQAEAYRDWIYGYQNDNKTWVYGQIQITESEKAQIQANLGLSNKQVEQNEGVRHQAKVARAEIADKTDEIDKASGNIEALQRELRLAEVRRDGLEENLALIEQFRTGLLSWEWVYIAQAKLEKTLAEENQEDIEIATEEWIERETAIIERQRWQASAAIVDIQQQGTEYDWQTALNLARAELGLADLTVVAPPDQTKFAELLTQLKSLKTEQADLPEELQSLMTEVENQLHSALQGEEVNNLTDRLLEMIDRFGEQVADHQDAMAELDKEIAADSQYIDDLYKTGHGLHLVSVNDATELPTEGRNVVIVAKIGDSYHVRIFDREEKLVLDKGTGEFSPDSVLVEKIDDAFSTQLSGQKIDFQTTNELLEEITSSLGYKNKSLSTLTREINEEAKTSQELQEKINELDVELRAAWNRITAATEDVILSEIEAKNLRDWIENVIEQRIKERKARRRARWFKAFGIIAMIITVAATIVTIGGGSALVAGILGLVAAGIQATMAGINKDWFGLATSVIQAVVNFVPALGTVLNSAGKPLVAASVASSIKNYGGALVSAIQSGKGFASGNELLGILEAFAIFSNLATEGLTQSIKNGATELTKNAQQTAQDVLDVIKKVPKKIYQGVEGIKSGDVLSAINGFFNAVIILGSKFAGRISDTLADVTDWLGKAGNTALIVGNFVKNGGILPLDQVLNIFAEDLKGLVEDYQEGELIDEGKKIAEAVEKLTPEDRVKYLSERLKDVPDKLAAQVIDNLDSTEEQVDILKNLPTEKKPEIFNELSEETQKEWVKGFSRSQLRHARTALENEDSPVEGGDSGECNNSGGLEYCAIAIVDAPSFWKESADFIAGVLAGEFNRDPSFGQILVGGLIEMIPGAGIPSAIRDGFAISGRFVTDPEEMKKPENWIGLGSAVLSAIPFIPGSSLGKLFNKVEINAIQKTVTSSDNVIEKLIITSKRLARSGSKDSRAIQSLKKKVDRQDKAFRNLPKTQESAEKIMKEVLTKTNENPIIRTGVNRAGKSYTDVFNPTTGRGVRMIEGEFDTFVNLD